ncbi:hypothetical protein RM704_24275 [Streptomyces sp. DSM 3412]|uniref:Uncharacterized protein n=1 Tax=Streptomyces gottesmaniae TaxID=3075518 RepID=A0ABU2Z1T8_9ACTN|nr:hypothetical protein [Streptomyces sp. DSM 3412]MDT0570545.1 hypothetical protein [Streptomyces sp. DSM 3412]
MIAWFDLAARGEAEVVTSPMRLVEAYDGRTTEQRRDWVFSRLKVADIGKDEARQARRLLAGAKLHGHKYAIDAVLAVIARQQKGQVTNGACRLRAPHQRRLPGAARRPAAVADGLGAADAPLLVMTVREGVTVARSCRSPRRRGGGVAGAVCPSSRPRSADRVPAVGTREVLLGGAVG